jgi:hypothetical protein
MKAKAIAEAMDDFADEDFGGGVYGFYSPHDLRALGFCELVAHVPNLGPRRGTWIIGAL